MLFSMLSSEAYYLSFYKSSKEAWNFLKRKYDVDFYIVVKDRSSSYKVGIYECLMLMAKSTHWINAESDKEYTLQETYDKIIYEHLKLKKISEDWQLSKIERQRLLRAFK